MTLDVSVTGDRERWVRDFGGRGLRSMQWLQSGLMVEQAGLLRFAFELSADATGIRYEFRRASLLCVPLPRFLSPGITAVAVAEGRGWRADIRLSFPWGGAHFAIRRTCRSRTTRLIGSVYVVALQSAPISGEREAISC